MNAETQNDAAEYVLGTLPADERTRFAERLKSDAALAATVRELQRRLSPLDATAPETTPRAEVWRAVEEATGGGEPSNVVRLRRRVSVWRGTAVVAGALAAALAILVVIDRRSLPPEPAGGRYVAIVDAEGREPALIAEVDTGAGLITVRSLHAETPAGRSLQLWHVAEGAAPRSLGILQASLDTQTIRDAAVSGPVNGVIAVSVEPEGGSLSGTPTGPVIYSGRLIPVE
jgi:anti-sigma-K factor RskA